MSRFFFFGISRGCHKVARGSEESLSREIFDCLGNAVSVNRMARKIKLF
jgi:hypothetical protein